MEEENQPSSNAENSITKGNVNYTIDESDRTACVVSCLPYKKNIIIPNSITHESHEYAVTSISNCSFKECDIGCCVYWFEESSVENITIPASVTAISGNFFKDTKRLKEIKIDPQNPVYKLVDDKLIVAKSSDKEKEHDLLLYAMKDAVKVTIPASIRTIGPYAFVHCSSLKKVEIPKNSQLKKIDRCAFFLSSIENFTIPPHITQICEGAFSDCEELREVVISPDSQLQEIEKEVFANTGIENFTIPPHITKISKDAFKRCEALKKFVIPKNSELKTIEGRAFCGSGLKKFYIPANATDLKDGCFYGMSNLTEIDIDPGNPLFGLVEGKFIVKKSSEKQQEKDVLVFATKDAFEVAIPASIRTIGPYSFEGCKQLQTVVFPANSILEAIDSYAFSESSLRRIELPASVTQIGVCPFSFEFASSDDLLICV